MDCLLDPFVLALPGPDASDSVYRDYANSLGNWSEVIRGKVHSIWFSYSWVGALVASNQYPFESNLRKLGNFNTIVSAYDIFRSCEKQIVNPPFIEDKLRLDANCVSEVAKLIVLPQDLEQRLHSSVALTLRETLANVAIAAQISHSEFANNLFFATTGLSDPQNQVCVDAVVHCDNDSGPVVIQASWHFVIDPEELDDLELWGNLWLDNPRAFKRAYRQLVREGAITPQKQPLPSIIVGKSFEEIILEKGYYNDETLLKSLFRNTLLALLDTGGYERHKYAEHNHHHPLQGSQSVQIVRNDDATAWRIHLSGDYRLHYWLLPDGRAELSKVGVHNDMTIY